MDTPPDDRWILDEIEAHLRSMHRAGITRLPRTPSPARARPAAAGLFPRQETLALLAALDQEVKECTRCEICYSRKQTVFGEGNPEARLLFIGEAPGFEEDRTGRPFVGKAGQLLDRMIAAIQLRREDVYIANVLKCRPPENRTPRPDEAENCFPYLYAQIRLICPAVICTLGLPAARVLLGLDRPIGSFRGQLFHFDGIPVVPTYHPAYLLRNPADKLLVWKDLQQVAGLLGIRLETS